MLFKLKKFRKWILIVIVLLGISILLVSSYNENQDKIVGPYHICNQIVAVDYKKTYFEVDFNKIITSINPLLLAEYFGFIASSNGIKYIMPPRSAYAASLNYKKLRFKFALPFAENVTGQLTCSNVEKISKTTIFDENEDNLLILKRYNITADDNKFATDTTDSQFICHGTNYFNRWCEGQNLAFSNQNILFQTKAYMSFPKKFLTLEGKITEYNSKFISQGRPIVIHRDLSEVSSGISPLSSNILYASPGQSVNNIYDLLSTFIIPAKKTLNIAKPNLTSKVDFYIPNEMPTMTKLAFFFKAIGLNTPINIPTSATPIRIKNMIIGIEKSTNKTKASFNFFQSLKMSHARNDTIGMRDSILKELNISSKRPTKPLVTLLSFNSPYTILNLDDIKYLIEKKCPRCEVNIHERKLQDITSTIKHVCNSTVLITPTISSQAEPFWMEPSSPNVPTKVIEIADDALNYIPDVKNAADWAGVKHYKFLNPHCIESDEDRSGTFYDCVHSHQLAKTKICFDHLSKYKFKVDLNKFEKLWDQIQPDFDYINN